MYAELIRMHKEEGLSFRNVIVFNMYEYYPLSSDAINSNFNALKEMLLDHVDIDKQNVFTPDGSIAKDTILEYCRLYEQRIESFGGVDIALLGIGRVGNIAFNEPGSRLNSTTRLILLDSASRNEAAKYSELSIIHLSALLQWVCLQSWEPRKYIFWHGVKTRPV